jgi:hypothetical protein
MTTSYTQCHRIERYTRQQCTAQVADEDGESLLCIKHLAQAGRDIAAGIGRLGLQVDSERKDV